MSNKKLRAIANSYQMFGGKVTVWMLPVATLRHDIAWHDALKLFAIKAEDWKENASDAKTMFYLAEGNMVDIEVADIADDDPFASEINGIKNYWENRNGNMQNNWDWFTSCINNDVCFDLYDAYKATRRVMPKIESDILQEPPPDIATDPKKTGSGRKRSTKKSVST